MCVCHAVYICIYKCICTWTKQRTRTYSKPDTIISCKQMHRWTKLFAHARSIGVMGFWTTDAHCFSIYIYSWCRKEWEKYTNNEKWKHQFKRTNLSPVPTAWLWEVGAQCAQPSSQATESKHTGCGQRFWWRSLFLTRKHPWALGIQTIYRCEQQHAEQQWNPSMTCRHSQSRRWASPRAWPLA